MTSRISLGVVGLNADWFESLEPLIGDSPRLSVAGYYDDAPIRRQLLPRGVRSQAVGGLQRLLHTPGLRALLCCTLGWRKHNLIEQVVERGLPLYLTAQGVDDLGNDLATLVTQVEESGAIVCPDLSWRYTPATLRLRELMAVRLGKCREMRIELPEFSPRCLRSMVDWCRFVTGSRGVPEAVRVGEAIQLKVDQTTVLLTPLPAAPETAESGVPALGPLWQIHCERGEAVLVGEDRIKWSSGAMSGAESLGDERRRSDVNLDLFLRRVVGGLVPAPTLADLLMAQNVMRAVLQ